MVQVLKFLYWRFQVSLELPLEPIFQIEIELELKVLPIFEKIKFFKCIITILLKKM
jgi:hypothetical protein